jgi:hypothetical protein
MSSFQKAQYVVFGMLIPVFGMVCIYAGAVYAQGPLNPPGAPAPTMKSLDQIYDRVGDAVNASMGLAAVDGIGWSRGVVGSPGVLGTVPAGYELVILRISAQSTTGAIQQILADGEVIFAGGSTRQDSHYAVDVPNGSIVVGPEVELTYSAAGNSPVAWVCGYLRSVQ